MHFKIAFEIESDACFLRANLRSGDERSRNPKVGHLHLLSMSIQTNTLAKQFSFS